MQNTDEVLLFQWFQTFLLKTDSCLHKWCASNFFAIYFVGSLTVGSTGRDREVGREQQASGLSPPGQERAGPLRLGPPGLRASWKVKRMRATRLVPGFSSEMKKRGLDSGFYGWTRNTVRWSFKYFFLFIQSQNKFIFTELGALLSRACLHSPRAIAAASGARLRCSAGCSCICCTSVHGAGGMPALCVKRKS